MVPPPQLVAAWFALDVLLVDEVPMWAAHWLIQGYDGDALRELAALSGRDSREVRDLLPDAFVDAGADPMISRSAAWKLAYDDIADRYLSGHLSWQGVVNKVDSLVIATGRDGEAFDEPLGELSLVVDEVDAGWGRSISDLQAAVHVACYQQLHTHRGGGRPDMVGYQR